METHRPEASSPFLQAEISVSQNTTPLQGKNLTEKGAKSPAFRQNEKNSSEKVVNLTSRISGLYFQNLDTVSSLYPPESYLINDSLNNDNVCLELNSYKFPKPRVYIKNSYPDTKVSQIDLLRDTAILMGTKERPSVYNEYLNTLLSLSKKRSVKRKIKLNKKQCVVNSLALPAGTGTMKMLDIMIENNSLQSLVDTGSTHSLISVESFKRLGLIDYEPVSMTMKVAGSTLKNNIIGSTELTMFLKTDGDKLFAHKMSFLIAHHINGYQAILGADFLLDPLHVMAITPYTIMLYERDRTVCAPFLTQKAVNKTVLLHNYNAIFVPMDETVEIDVACACNTVLSELKKFTPLVTFLKKGILIKKSDCKTREQQLHSYIAKCWNFASRACKKAANWLFGCVT